MQKVGDAMALGAERRLEKLQCLALQGEGFAGVARVCVDHSQEAYGFERTGMAGAQVGLAKFDSRFYLGYCGLELPATAVGTANCYPDRRLDQRLTTEAL